MPDDLDDLIRRTRRVVRARGEAEPPAERPAERPAEPPGFAERVSCARRDNPSAPANLILWQRLSYIGVAVACALAMISALIFRAEADAQLAPDPWLEMPMSSLSDEFENGGTNER